MVEDIKKEQLGLNASTAAHRLRKAIMFSFINKLNLNKCYQCGDVMTIDTFSIEHKTPWLHSDDPVRLFYDLDNIAFSHRKCNTEAARRGKTIFTDEDRKVARRKWKHKHESKLSKEEKKKRRREQYLRTGK